MTEDDRKKRYQPAARTGDVLPSPTDLIHIFSRVTTPHLVLRRLQSTDSRAVFAVHSDPEANRYSSAGPDPDLAASRERLRYWLQHWERYGFGYWAVVLPHEKKEVIGFGGVEHMIWRNRHVLSLYYRFMSRVWGKGYTTELASTAVTLAREHLPRWPIIVRMRADNASSIRVAERIGLLRRPDLDTEIVFALDWTHIDDH